MIETSYEELHRLIENGQAARAYAWNHFDELVSRKASYTLYGPDSSFMGAAIPCHMIPARERKLLKNTRREKYMKYELDQNFRTIRVVSMYQYERVYSIYHVFELNGVIYGCPFKEDMKQFLDYRTEAYRLTDGKPLYYAQTADNSIFCEFYEYPTAEIRTCTGYLYSRTCKETSYKLLPNWDAPLGSPASPVTVHYYKSPPWDLDFSKYFL